MFWPLFGFEFENGFLRDLSHSYKVSQKVHSHVKIYLYYVSRREYGHHVLLYCFSAVNLDVLLWKLEIMALRLYATRNP